MAETKASEFWVRVDRSDPSGCWLWMGGRNPKGYGYISGRRPVQHAHRFAWMLEHHRPIPSGMWVLHSCDNPPCVNPAHLFLGTAGDNNMDCARKGRHGTRTHPESFRRGQNHPRAVLTERDVREIRERSASGESLISIARRLGANKETVRSIARGRSWKHIGSEAMNG